MAACLLQPEFRDGVTGDPSEPWITERLLMSVQQLVVGVSDGPFWADAHPDNPATAGRVSLRETCHLLFVIGLLLLVTLGLLTSTALIDAVLRMIAGIG